MRDVPFSFSDGVATENFKGSYHFSTRLDALTIIVPASIRTGNWNMRSASLIARCHLFSRAGLLRPPCREF